MNSLLDALNECLASPRSTGIATAEIVARDPEYEFTYAIMERTEMLAAKQAASTGEDALENPAPEDQTTARASGNLRLVWNRFNVLPVHLLLVAISFRHQLEPLCLDDFHTIQPLLTKSIVAFNCGQKSGASQPRKHLHIIGLPLTRDDSFPLEDLVGAVQEIAQPTELSIFEGRRHCIIRFGPNTPTSQTLYSYYCAALNHCGVLFTRQAPGIHEKEEDNRTFNLPLEARTGSTPIGNLLTDETYYANQDYSFLLTAEFCFLGVRSTGFPLDVGCNSISYTGNLYSPSKAMSTTIATQGAVAILREGLACKDVHLD